MNPWKVESVQEFAFLNCPECEFKDKDEENFQDHAVKYHPKSSVLFKNASDIIISEQDSAIGSIIVNDIEINNEDVKIFQIDPVNYSTTAQTIFTQELEAYGNGQNPEFYIQVLENENVAPVENQAKKSFVNVAPLQEYDLKHTKERKERSVQALINVLEELGNDEYKCITCDKGFPKAIEMKKHCQQEHTDKDGYFICKHCPRKEKTLKELVRHIKTRHVSKKCQICGKVLKMSVFNLHMKGVHGDKYKKDWKCDRCDFATHCSKYLQSHKRFKHPSNKRRKF